METSLAFTIIAVALTLLGLFKFIAPKKFNENAMGELHEEAVNPAAAISGQSWRNGLNSCFNSIYVS